MSLMSTSIIFHPIPVRSSSAAELLPKGRSCWMCQCFRNRRRRFLRLVVRAEIGNGRRRPWWERLFLEDDHAEGTGFSMNDGELLGDLEDVDEESSEEQKFEAWRRRAEAITELWDAKEAARNAESRAWEDWLEEGHEYEDGGIREEDWIECEQDPGEDSGEPAVPVPERGLMRTIRELVLRGSDDELLFEDRVFKYASVNSAKFLAVLFIVPWALDFMAHDFLIMPFLDRYVKTVPLAAEFFDVRRDQKLEMIKVLKLERARYRFEVEIGKAPPLSDDEVWLELRHKAIELRDEWRFENRKSFANIWSDMVYGITLFLLVYFNQSRVALLKFTGYKLLNNVSDTGKAFLIILITDIFLGYHSESGWEALIEAFLEHYGLGIDQAAVTIFVCFVPVVIDACVKLWLFKFLPRISPNVMNIFREMKRH